MSVKYYRIDNAIAKEENGLWYRRDTENHKWIMDGNQMARYFDAQYDVVEICYDENQEFAHTARYINGFESTTQGRMVEQINEQATIKTNTAEFVYCVACGEKLLAAWKYCPRCGSKSITRDSDL